MAIQVPSVTTIILASNQKQSKQISGHFLQLFAKFKMNSCTDG